MLNSPYPVDGDVQALISDCQRDIEEIQYEISTYGDESGRRASKLKRQQIALAALTAEPVAYTDAEELETLRKGTFADMFTPHESYKADQLWIPLYTTPPAQLLRPVELPEPYDDGHGNLWLPQDAVISAVKNAGGEVKNNDNH